MVKCTFCVSKIVLHCTVLALTAVFFVCISATRQGEEIISSDTRLVAENEKWRLPQAEHAALFAGENYHEVIPLGRNYIVRNFTNGEVPLSRMWRSRRFLGRWLSLFDAPRDIGRYNERRGNMYERTVASVGESAGFGGARNIHVGIDIGAPARTPVRNFFDGEIFKFGYNPGDGDYGHVIITRHTIKGRHVYALWGHLSGSSMARKYEGQRVAAGEILGYLGGRGENGGWPPHLHLQLALGAAPDRHDLPGVVSARDHTRALDEFPDPQLGEPIVDHESMEAMLRVKATGQVLGTLY